MDVAFPSLQGRHGGVLGALLPRRGFEPERGSGDRPLERDGFSQGKDQSFRGDALGEPDVRVGGVRVVLRADE